MLLDMLLKFQVERIIVNNLSKDSQSLGVKTTSFNSELLTSRNTIYDNISCLLLSCAGLKKCSSYQNVIPYVYVIVLVQRKIYIVFKSCQL